MLTLWGLVTESVFQKKTRLDFFGFFVRLVGWLWCFLFCFFFLVFLCHCNRRKMEKGMKLPVAYRAVTLEQGKNCSVSV